MTWKAAQQVDILLQDERRHMEEFKAKYDNLRIEMETALENERRTVSILVSEKVHLTSKLEKLEDFESSTFYLQQSFQQVLTLLIRVSSFRGFAGSGTSQMCRPG